MTGRTVTRRRTGIARAAAAVALIAVAWIDGAGIEFQARATACCTHRHDCGGDLRAPDACCEHMGHSTPARTAVNAQLSIPAALTLVAVLPREIPQSSAVHPRTRATPRLHDPPHLHTFALLI